MNFQNKYFLNMFTFVCTFTFFFLNAQLIWSIFNFKNLKNPKNEIVNIVSAQNTNFSISTYPEQPLCGPGGQEYPYPNVVQKKFGLSGSGYYIFIPETSMKVKLPIISFVHGFGGTTPSTYKAWIYHLVKKGNVVIFPVYQSFLTPISKYTKNSGIAISEAIKKVPSEYPNITLDLTRFALVGHSMGGVIVANLAATYSIYNIPFPGAVMAVQPGKTPMPPLEDLSKIRPETLLLTLSGDKDIIVGDTDAKKIFNQAVNVLPLNKNRVKINSGKTLSADHFISCGSSSDPLDYYCLWKLFDGLYWAAFYNMYKEYALGDTYEQKFMGIWPDTGKEIKPLTIFTKSGE